MAPLIADILFVSNTLGGILGVLILIAWLLALIDIFRRPDLDRTHRLAWILIVVVVPIVGTLLYFGMRPTLPDEAERVIQAETRRH